MNGALSCTGVPRLIARDLGIFSALPGLKGPLHAEFVGEAASQA